MSDLSALIEKLSAATEGSEALDREIADTVLEPAGSVRLVGGSVDIPQWRYPDGSVGTELRFSRSLDAALSLVPEGWQWDAGTFAVDEVFNPGGAQAAVHEHSRSDRYAHGEAATPALALCIAALRAREAADV